MAQRLGQRRAKRQAWSLSLHRLAVSPGERLLALAAGIALAVSVSTAGCTDATPGEVHGDVGVTQDAGPAPDTGTPLDLLTVDTGVSDDGPSAGDTVHVFCSVQGLQPGEAAPATTWEMVGSPDDLSDPPAVDGDDVVFHQAGEYRFRCTIDATGWTDPTPVRVTVGAGAPAWVETTVSPSALTAGQVADVLCEGEDGFGNPVDSGWDVGVAPAGDSPGEVGGLLYANQKVKALVVGTYEVACKPAGWPADATPAQVTVEHGLPYRLVTTLADDQVVAGESTAVSCRAEDKQGNEVPDLPMTIDLADTLSLTGLQVGGTVSGQFMVRCVPAGLDWSTFVLDEALLEVLPGPPVTLAIEAQPPKPYFGVSEVVTIVVLAEDAFGNPVPDAEILPLTVSPDQDFVATSPTTLRFFVEGYYTVTAALAADPSVTADLEVAIEGAPPAVTVTYPPRGATLQGLKPSVTVEGVAKDAIAGIQSVTVNGHKAKLHDDGTFTKVVVPKWGMNELTVEATDGSGAVTRVLQSFYFAERYYSLDPEIPLVPDSLKLWLAKEFLDDGDHNPTHPDDLATILELVLAGFDLSSALPPSTDIGSGYSLELGNLSFNPPTLNLTPVQGGLQTHIAIKNLSMDVKLHGDCPVLGVDLCPDFSGSVAVNKILLDAFLKASAAEGVLDVDLLNPQVDLQGIDVQIDGILGWLFDWLIDFVVNQFTGTIESALESQIGGMLGDTLAQVFDALSITQSIEIPALLPGMTPTSLTFEAALWTLAFAPEGGRVGLGARVLAPNKVPQKILGSIARGTCLKGYPALWQLPGTSRFELGLFDDFLNEALAAVWRNGLLNVSLDQDTIGDLAGSSLPLDGMTVDTTALLPPILNGCDPSGLIKLQLGDLFVEATLLSPLFDGGEGKLGVYAYVEASAELVLEDTDEGPMLSVVIQSLDTFDLHWSYVPPEFEGNEQALEDLLIGQIIDGPVQDMIGVPLGQFPVPTLDLGAMLPGLDTSLTLTPIIDDLTRQGGHTLIQGELE